jgi:nitroimidazol reductase NimA-like FMN-containing flavoprotein (pyridoxamine 5'-phosphate oxidase superfamily)
MSKLNVAFGHGHYSDAALGESIGELLAENSLGAMASVDNGVAHIHTAYFVHSADLTLYFLSQPTDAHTRFIAQNPSVAVAIWSTPVSWGEDLRGVQVFGRCDEVKAGAELLAGMRLFLSRFPAFKAIVKRPGEFKAGIASRMFAVRPSALRLLDEPRFGRRNYIDLALPQ